MARRLKRTAVAAVAAVALSGTLAACGSDDAGGNTLVWWQNPDASGTQKQIARNCTEASGGRYRIQVEELPQSADQQREQLVRRLAANDQTMNLMNMDVIWTGEFAEAGWLLPWKDQREVQATAGMLQGPLKTATWQDAAGQDVLYGIPFSTNTQLLWYRKSRAEAIGVDPASDSFTWDGMIKAAVSMPKGQQWIEEQGNRYEGYMVWVNALVESAGGSILDVDGNVTIDSEAGRRAAEVVSSLATSAAADPGLSTADEEAGRASFENGGASFMLNWPYVYATAVANAPGNPQLQEVVNDYAWARYPRVSASMPSAPPLGGINIGIGASTPEKKRAIAYEAALCASNEQNQLLYMRNSGNPSVLKDVYDDPEVRKAYPFADLIKESVDEAGPRPVTPFYNEVSLGVQRTWHPPRSVNQQTPRETANLIRQAIDGEILL